MLTDEVEAPRPWHRELLLVRPAGCIRDIETLVVRQEIVKQSRGLWGQVLLGEVSDCSMADVSPGIGYRDNQGQCSDDIETHDFPSSDFRCCCGVN